MPLLYWALEDIQQEQVIGGFIITTKSDVAVHMWLRWTYKEPQKHAKPVERRGLLISWDARFCFVAFCDVEQEEEGDTYTHTFHIPSDEPPPDPPTSEWPFYEPWGASLTENYPWIKYKEPEVPNITFDAGVVKIENPGYEDCGITYSPPVKQLPLAYTDDKPLKIAFNNTEATADSTSSQLSIELLFRKGDEWMRIYLCVACGVEHDDKKPWSTGYVGDLPYGWLFVDTGEHTIDLLDWFKTFRADLGLSTSPIGWFLELIAFALGTFNPAITDHLKNDYLGCYLPQESLCNMQPWLNCETRYFYFWATNAGEKMKSTSCIFSKHYAYEAPPYGPPVTVKFYPTPGSDGVAADGRAYRVLNNEIWQDKRTGAGTNAEPDGMTGYIGFTCGGNADTWYVLYRTLLHFDTLLLPVGCLIDAASVHVRGYEKSNTIPSNPSLALVSSHDPAPGNIVPHDYLYAGVIHRAPEILYADFSSEGWNVFTLFEASFEYIIREGITQFALREGSYDRPDIEPPYNRYKTSYFRVSMRDDIEDHWPYLEITYRPLL